MRYIKPLLQWHYELRRYLHEKKTISETPFWAAVGIIGVSLIANILTYKLIYYMGLVPDRFSNKTHDPSEILIALVTQIYATLILYQFKPDSITFLKYRYNKDGIPHLPRLTSVFFYTFHVLGFIIITTHSYLWHNKII